jgi:hypothetical protein
MLSVIYNLLLNRHDNVHFLTIKMKTFWMGNMDDIFKFVCNFNVHNYIYKHCVVVYKNKGNTDKHNNPTFMICFEAIINLIDWYRLNFVQIIINFSNLYVF